MCVPLYCPLLSVCALGITAHYPTIADGPEIICDLTNGAVHLNREPSPTSKPQNLKYSHRINISVDLVAKSIICV